MSFRLAERDGRARPFLLGGLGPEAALASPICIHF